MDIYSDIIKATKIPHTQRSVQFISAMKDSTTKVTMTPPKNAKLLETDPQNDTHEGFTFDCFPNEHELTATIRAVNGGMDYSNDTLLHNLKIRQDQASKKLSSDSSGIASISSEDSTSRNEFSIKAVSRKRVKSKKMNKSKETDESKKTDKSKKTDELKKTDESKKADELKKTDVSRFKEALKKYGLSKNALIIGLLNNNIISLEDLEVNGFKQSHEENIAKNAEKVEEVEDEDEDEDEEEDEEEEEEEDSSDDSNDNNDVRITEGSKEEKKVYETNNLSSGTDSATSTVPERESYENSRGLNLVPHPEDPDVLTHPLQADKELNYDGVDLTIDRIGKKETVTSRQYFIKKIDDKHFKFASKAKDAKSSSRSGKKPSQ